VLPSVPAAFLWGISLILLAHPAHGNPGAYPHLGFLGKVRGIACLLFHCEQGCELGDEVVGGRVEDDAVELVIPRRKKAWEASLGGEIAARPHVAARVVALPSGRPGRPLPDDDRELVMRLAGDTWHGLDSLIDREHQLPIDHVHLGGRPGDLRVGDYANVTTIGLRLVSIVAAHELGFLSRTQAADRLRAVLATLATLETYQGFFYNYYDTTSLERTSNLISFVDSSWLTAGLIVTRQAFPELAPDATRLIDGASYRFFYDERLGRMAHGYWVQRESPSRYHYGMLYAESRLGSLIAIGKGDVPESHWYRMARTLPATCGWQRRVPVERREKRIGDERFYGGWYTWENERFVASWGGSMFEALMPTLVLDEARLAPAGLGANDAAHVTVQRRWALETLGYPAWGLSPSMAPATGEYREFGAHPLGVLGYEGGAVTPHASALVLPLDLPAAAANLRLLAERWPLYGDFGFYDAVDPQTGAVARSYLALDQSMIFLAAANALTDGAVQRHFAADPIIARVLPLLAAEHFFD
jgi:hypothetical protein